MVWTTAKACALFDHCGDAKNLEYSVFSDDDKEYDPPDTLWMYFQDKDGKGNGSWRYLCPRCTVKTWHSPDEHVRHYEVTKYVVEDTKCVGPLPIFGNALSEIATEDRMGAT